MSHSQFHSTNLFILRHAWLNLWDKHMTTGRINQVTTFRITLAGDELVPATIESLSQPGVRQQSCVQCSILTEEQSLRSSDDVLARSTDRASLSPGLTCFGYHFSRSVPKTGIALLFEDYQRPESSWKDAHSHGGSPSGYLKTGLAISK